MVSGLNKIWIDWISVNSIDLNINRIKDNIEYIIFFTTNKSVTDEGVKLFDSNRCI